MAPSAEATVEPIQPPPTPPTDRPLHTLPAPFTDSNLTVLAQGAEALVYKTVFLTPNTPCVVKYRPPKPYRHPTLDRRLTKARILAEARVLVRCKKEGVSVPGVLGADWDEGWLALEWVEGKTVRRVLDGWAERITALQREGKKTEEETEDEAMLGLMRRVGRVVGRLHEIGVCHGDLTTSNLMLKPPERADVSTNGQVPPESSRPAGRQTVSAMRETAITETDSVPPPSPPSRLDTSDSLEGEVTLIDFGLATQSTRAMQEEERAVDLYVLERAFAATHPAAEPLFQEVLKSYGESFKGARLTLRRLEDVRLRGRKRSMLG